MNRKNSIVGALLTLGLCAGGCSSDTRVTHELKQLKQAEQDSPKVASEIQKDLDKAKAEVVRLEEELALAKQGITKDVLEERKDLKDALKAQSDDVQEEIIVAKRASREHTSQADVARNELERTMHKEHVEARVRTETQVTPVQNDVTVQKQTTTIPVENAQVVERTTATPIDPAEIERRRAAQHDRSAGLQP